MSASKVYFTDMRCPVGTGLLDKLKKLIEKAGIDSIDMDSKFVAIKIHFGEPGNLSFLRPNFAKVVADKVTSLGGRPFLTDCNTLYVGRRKHAPGAPGRRAGKRLLAPEHRLPDDHRRRPQGHRRDGSAPGRL